MGDEGTYFFTKGESRTLGTILMCFFGIYVGPMLPLLFMFLRRKKRRPYSVDLTFPKVAFFTWLVFNLFCLICGISCLAADRIHAGASTSFIIVFFIYYVGLSVACPENVSTFKRFNGIESLEEHLQTVRQSGIDLSFHVVASHSESHTERVAVTQYDYVNHTSHTVYENRTVTHVIVDYEATRHVPVRYWIDVTESLILPSASPYVRIREKLDVDWCDDAVDKIQSFLYTQTSNRYPNDLVSVSKNVTVKGISEHTIFRNPLNKIGCCNFVNPLLVIPLCVLGFGPHTAFLVAMVAPVVRFTVKKKASISTPISDGEAVVSSTAPLVQMDSFSDSYQETQPVAPNQLPLYVMDPNFNAGSNTGQSTPQSGTNPLYLETGDCQRTTSTTTTTTTATAFSEDSLPAVSVDPVESCPPPKPKRPNVPHYPPPPKPKRPGVPHQLVVSYPPASVEDVDPTTESNRSEHNDEIDQTIEIPSPRTQPASFRPLPIPPNRIQNSAEEMPNSAETSDSPQRSPEEQVNT